MKIAIVYASMTGNTEMIAEEFKAYFDKHSVEYQSYHINHDDFFAFDLADYDAILFGSYTYGDGELPFELEDFYDELDDEDLSGKIFSLFGSCDSFYPLYGVALDILADKFTAQGATVVGEYLKVDLAPDGEDIKQVHTLADTFLNATK